jgi:hypothetical protein
MSSIFSFFCLDAKEPKDQVGKSSAKKRYFFLKIPELERLFGFSLFVGFTRSSNNGIFLTKKISFFFTLAVS